MRRCWLAVMVVVVCGAVVGSRMIAHAQETPAPSGEPPVAAPAPSEAPPTPAAPVTPAAPEAPAPGEKPAETKVGGVSWFELIWYHSGWEGWSIILLSFVAVYMVIRFSFDLRRPKLLPEGLLNALAEDLDNGRLRQAVERCKASDNALARVVRSGLSEMRTGYDGMMAAMEETAEAESVRLNQQVGWLAVIGAIAPMLGLLGTVDGMMGAFGTISQMEMQPPPRMLAGNIQLALVTTFEGLTVAIPVLVAYSIFRNRVLAIVIEVGVAGADLIGRFRGVEITPGMVAQVSEALGEAGPPVPPPAPEAAEEAAEEEAAPPPPPAE